MVSPPNSTPLRSSSRQMLSGVCPGVCSTVRSRPPSSTWSYRPTTATRTLRDGDQVELGGRDLTVLHTPGHPPDSICLLDERNGVLFGGDTINTGPIYA